MKLFKPVFLILMGIFLLSGQGFGQTPVTLDEAGTIAAGWIDLVTSKKGSWARTQDAVVETVLEFKKLDLLVGYICKINPEGIIVVSRYKELPPVNFYTDHGTFDPDAEEGLPLFLKDYMARQVTNLEALAAKTGATKPGALNNMMEIDYSPVWNLLLGLESKSGDVVAANYLEGEILLSSSWHQRAPYNDDCPNLGCSDTGNGRALVGCVATAGAQIMRYWNWPPYGSGSPYNDRYDWSNMMDAVGLGSPQAQIDAVAELNHEVGQAVSMNYGCESSTATTSDMEGVFQNHYRYSTACRTIYRENYTHDEWYGIMKDEFNVNRPVQYRIPGHSIVLDGWEEYYVNPTTVKNVHINYGWSGGTNSGWFTLYAIPGGDPDEEYMVENIYPAQVLPSTIVGTTYTRDAAFPYRYVAWDTTGSAAIFEEGQNIQFLPGVFLKCTSGTITLNGTSGYNTRLFTRGNESTGIRIQNGTMRISSQGGIRFH